jgi:peptidoglycan-associated lipoprotein
MPPRLDPIKSIVFACAIALAACSSTKVSPPEAQGGRSAAATGNSDTAPGATGSGTSQSSVTSVDLTKSPRGDEAALNVVYFDFDSFVVKDEFRPVVETGARKLAADRKRHVTVEGYADERGSSEYNLALGQRRAEAVVKSMQLLGADSVQMEPVSYGKERPAAAGHDETAWAKNRRAEIVMR